MNQRENFVRIAMARLRKLYPYTRQRLAVAGKMYSRWLDKKKSKSDDLESLTKFKDMVYLERSYDGRHLLMSFRFELMGFDIDVDGSVNWDEEHNSYILDVNSCQITFWTTPYQEKDVTDDYHYHYLYTLINEELPKIPFAGN